MKYKNLRGWIVLILIVSSIIAFSATPYTPIHSIYNESDLGASLLKESLDKFDYNISRMLISPIILNTQKDIEVIVIIGSDRKYTSAEINAYEKFVNDGGMLFIFEDFGPAKQIASKMGVTFMPGMLRDIYEPFHINRPSQMFVQDILITQLVEGMGQLALLASEAVAIIDLVGFSTGQSIPILMTFPSTFIDINNNNVMEAGDLLSPIGFPLGLFKFVGNGTLIVVGDSSIPLNQYWQKTVPFGDGEILLANAFWTLVVMTTLMNTYGKTSIVFDESHQEMSLTSATGIFNILAGTWVGLWNTIEVTVLLSMVTLGYTYNKVKSKNKKRFRRNREINLQRQDNDLFISHPSSAEKAISEQYLLYKVMDDRFIQIANANLIKKIRSTGKADDFLEELRIKYDIQHLNEAMTFDKLLQIHNELREYVEENTQKWL